MTPTHIAYIMDGNGRWAKALGKTRSYGHKKGFENLVNVIEYSKEIGVKYMTCYAFSTENWNRPKDEVDYLMNVPVELYNRERDRLLKEEIKITFIGRRDRIPEATLHAIEQIEQDTKHCTQIEVLIAFDYGARDELVRAVRKINESSEQDISEQTIEDYLDTAGVPPVDLLIRTSGEQRVSNYLLWQIAYAELYFTDTYWPAFSKEDLLLAIEAYNNRSRRYGSIK